jgi:predicted Rossmann-fold nucleotide-binding protein
MGPALFAEVTVRLAIIGTREKFLADPAGVRKRVQEFVAALPRETVVISGGARGVDSYAADAARLYGNPLVVYPADWEAAPRVAGFIRNTAIAQQSDLVVAFWDGHSAGTHDTLKKARKLGKEIQVFTVRRRELA